VAGYTPGPWVVVYSDRNGAALRIEAPSDRGVPGAAGSVVRHNGIGIPASPTGLANAKLIAAAPELLRCLQQLHDDIAEYARINNLGGYNNHVMRQARDAIKLAMEGRK
jgi:hypothetical protein